ncbi:APC family permease [Leucobacter chinensis]|uniref:APC family permease n=1 Tax=Leucobacter chinensis TaxID=2851010 RepID=UPI001C225128|nr:APC family permease [Leucobacter chinensis]
MTDTATPVKLKRTLGLVSLTAFGVTYMTVVTVFTTYGFVNKETGGHLPAAYLLAIIAMLFTALSYGAMVRKYPIAGSAYTYSQQSFGGGVGFMTGWVMLLDYLFLPMINFLLIGIYMNTQFPAVPSWAFSLVAIALVLGFNILGINFVSKANAVIISLSVILVAVFIALAFKSALGGDTTVGLLEPFTFGEGGIGAIAAGAAILALSFLGFDAVSTLSEEAKNPRRDIPRAIVLATLVGGFFFILVAWSGAIAFDVDWSTMSEAELDAAGVTVMKFVGGDALTSFFVAVFVAGSFGSAMTSQVSVSRIIYAMGRDGVLPRGLARVHKRFGTPIVAATLVSVISLTSLFISLEIITHMISFGALAAFMMVNLSVIRTYLFPRGGRTKPLTAGYLLRYGLLPLIGAGVTVWLWSSLETFTWIAGGIWVVLGLGIIVAVTRGFKRPVPMMDFSEEGATTRAIDQMGADYPFESQR